MSALVTAFIGWAWPYLMAAAGGLMLVIQQRRAGAKAERAKQAAREAEARDIKDEIQNDIGALPPEVARRRLEQWSKD